MKVTDITRQKHNEERVSVFVDDKYAFSLDEVDAVKLKIKIGAELTQKDIERCCLESNLSKAMKKALNILAVKPMTCRELEKKLFEKGYDEAVTSVAIAELEDMGYINDYDYACMYIEYAAQKCHGEKKIRFELAHRGVDADIIEDAICDKFTTDADEMAEMIYAKYGDVDMSDMKTKQRVTRFFASRGFGFGDINDALRRYEQLRNEE